MWNMLRLLVQRNFGSLNVAQFVTVFNDNALKQSFLLITVDQALEGSKVGYEEQALATILFSVPFLLLSGFAGRFTDWISKRTVVVGSKFAEFLIMGIALYGFAEGGRMYLLIALLLLATQSTFFSPAKYGILPEMLPREKLSAANGLLQTTSYIAILVGTAFSGIMLEQFEEQRIWVGVVLAVMAVCGWLVSMLIDPRKPANPEKPLFSGIPLVDELTSLSWIVKRRFLFLSMLGYAYVWMVGTVLLFNINVYGMDTLGLGKDSTSLLLILLSIGLGGGCLIAGLLSGERIEAGLVPVGAFGMGLSLMCFLFEPGTMSATATVLITAGFFGGFFLIPLQTLLQELPEDDRKGEALGIANVITFLGVILSSGLYMVAVGWLELSPTQLMILLGGLTIVAGGLIVYLVPRFLVRFVLFALNCTVVRTRVNGHDFIPGRGPVLMTLDQDAPIASVFIDYAVDRPVHFVRLTRSEDDTESSLMTAFLRMTTITDSPPAEAGEDEESIQSRLQSGNVVCVLREPEAGQVQRMCDDPEEGGRSRSEEIEQITVSVEGLEASVFGSGSFESMGEFLSRIPATVSVSFEAVVKNEEEDAREGGVR